MHEPGDIRMEKPPYELILWWGREDDAFVIGAPELPGCIACGPTRQEATGIGRGSHRPLDRSGP